jgi:PTS system mannose-specific IIC component
MMDPVVVGLLLAWGTLVGLDLVSFPQAMLNRPLVAGAVAGALAGNLQVGLQVGVVLELFALDVLPIGASRYPDYGPAAAVAGAMAALRPWAHPDGVGVAAALGLVLAAAGGLTMELVRRANGRRIRSAEAALTSGDGRVLERLHWLGLATDALRALLVTGAGLLLAGPVMTAVEALPGLQRALTIAVIAGGLASAVHGLSRQATRGTPRWWAWAGLAVGLVVAWLG